MNIPKRNAFDKKNHPFEDRHKTYTHKTPTPVDKSPYICSDKSIITHYLNNKEDETEISHTKL